MAYTPTNWQCGDVVTAEALNKIEQGIASASGGSSPIAPLILQQEVDDTDPSSPITYIPTPFATIRDAFLSGRMVLLDPVDVGKDYSLMVGLNVKQDGGAIAFPNNVVFAADGDTLYPQLPQNTSN